MKLDELLKIINADVGDGTTVSDSDAFTRREIAKKFLEKHAVIVLPELVEALKAIRFAIDTYARDTIWVDGWKGAGNGVHITAHDVIDEILARAETVLTDGK